MERRRPSARGCSERTHLLVSVLGALCCNLFHTKREGIMHILVMCANVLMVAASKAGGMVAGGGEE